MAYNGWMIIDEQRDALLAAFPPVYEHVRCSHITHIFDEDESYDIPIDADVVVVGYVRGPLAEALIVEVNGTTMRPNGETYHVTVSFPEGSSAAASNEMVSAFDIIPVPRKVIVVRGFTCSGSEMPYVTTPLSAKQFNQQ